MCALRPLPVDGIGRGGVMEDRYFYAAEDEIWCDRTKPWDDPENVDGDLYEEIDPGEVMNDQDAAIAQLLADNEILRGERDALRAENVVLRENAKEAHRELHRLWNRWNDGKLRYTQEQAETFDRIASRLVDRSLAPATTAAAEKWAAMEYALRGIHRDCLKSRCIVRCEDCRDIDNQTCDLRAALAALDEKGGGERMEAARCALHKGNARCTGEGKQEAIIAALDAIGWEAPDA